MREHKYRAWDRAKQQMCEVLTLLFWDPEPGGRLELGSCELVRNMGDYRACYRAKIEDIDLMEYAGRADEKGNDVFEGDVLGVDDPSDDSVAVVVFHDGAFKAQIKEGVYDHHWGGWIVIGNRHEHPHLLNSQQEQQKLITFTYTNNDIQFNCANCSVKQHVSRILPSIAETSFCCDGCGVGYHILWSQGKVEMINATNVVR